MSALPTEVFENKKQTRAKVQKNYHVFIGEDKNYYSVHFLHVGKQVQVSYNSLVVEIFHKETRIAIHKRLYGKGTYKYATITEHMPPRHQVYKHLQGHTGEDFKQLAARLGPNTHWAISRILISRIHEQQAYKSCLGVLRLAKKYGKERLEAACERCQEIDHVSYGRLNTILLTRRINIGIFMLRIQCFYD